MDPAEHAHHAEQLRRQLAVARTAAAELRGWLDRPPTVAPGDWSGPAAAAHAASCAALAARLSGCVALADELVDATRVALAVEVAS